MALLAQLSDLHLTADGEDFGAAERLALAVGALARVRPRLDALLITGDLADDGTPEAYAKVLAAVEPLGLPLHVLPGNHDERGALRAAFALPGDGPIRGTGWAGELRLVLLDSILPGRPDGALPPEELAWLDATLLAEPSAPTLVALHHPPVLTGMAFMDGIGLPAADRAALAAVVEAHPQVLLSTAGHIHVAMSAVFAGRPFLTAPSCARSLAADLRPDADTLAMAGSRPAFVLHQYADGALRSHVVQALADREIAPPISFADLLA